MKIVIIERGKKRLNKLLEWLLYIFGYTFVLIIVSIIFNEYLIIENSLYGLLAVLIIYMLNKTIKPILVRLTLPITGLTLGIFYPFINILILYIVSFIMKGHFQITGISNIKGIIVLFFMALLISFMNFILEYKIIKPILEKERSKYDKRSSSNR